MSHAYQAPSMMSSMGGFSMGGREMNPIIPTGEPVVRGMMNTPKTAKKKLLARGTFFVKNNLLENKLFSGGDGRTVPEGYTMDDYSIEFPLCNIDGVSKLFHVLYNPELVDNGKSKSTKSTASYLSLLSLAPHVIPRGMDVCSVLKTLYSSRFKPFLPSFGCDFIDRSGGPGMIQNHMIIMETCYPFYTTLDGFCGEFQKLRINNYGHSFGGQKNGGENQKSSSKNAILQNSVLGGMDPTSMLQGKIIARIFAQLISFLKLSHAEDCMGWFDLLNVFIKAGYSEIKFFNLGFNIDLNLTRQQKVLKDYENLGNVLDKILGLNVTNSNSGNNNHHPAITSGNNNHLAIANYAANPSVNPSMGGGNHMLSLQNGNAIGNMISMANRSQMGARQSQLQNSIAGGQVSTQPMSTLPVDFDHDRVEDGLFISNEPVDDSQYGDNYEQNFRPGNLPMSMQDGNMSNQGQQFHWYPDPPVKSIHSHGESKQSQGVRYSQQRNGTMPYNMPYKRMPHNMEGTHQNSYDPDDSDLEEELYDGGYDNIDEGSTTALILLQQIPSLADFRSTLQNLKSLTEAEKHPFMIEFLARDRIESLYGMIQCCKTVGSKIANDSEQEYASGNTNLNGNGNINLNGNLMDERVIRREISKFDLPKPRGGINSNTSRGSDNSGDNQDALRAAVGRTLSGDSDKGNAGSRNPNNANNPSMGGTDKTISINMNGRKPSQMSTMSGRSYGGMSNMGQMGQMQSMQSGIKQGMQNSMGNQQNSRNSRVGGSISGISTLGGPTRGRPLMQPKMSIIPEATSVREMDRGSLYVKRNSEWA